MSDYTQTTDFSAKDALDAGDPEKVILGSDVDAELSAISTAIGTKANNVSGATNNNVALLDANGDLKDAGYSFSNLSGDVTSTAAELNKLDGFTGVVADLNIISGGDAAGVTSTEFQYLDGVTEAIQTQLDRVSLSANGVLAEHKNLVITNNSTNPAYQVDIDADAVLLTDSSDNKYQAKSINLTAALDQSGADGLDTGSEATSTWYYLWVIYNGSTTASLLSTSSTTPTMPSGYTYKGLVGAVYNDSGGDFITIEQHNKFVAISSNTAINNNSSTSYTSVSLSSIVPATAATVHGTNWMNNAGGGTVSTAISYVASTSSGLYESQLSEAYSASTNVFNSACQMQVLLIETQTIYAKVNNGGLDQNVYITGWGY